MLLTITKQLLLQMKWKFCSNFTILLHYTSLPTLTINQHVSVTASNKTNDNTPSIQIHVDKAGTLSTNIVQADTVANTANVLNSGGVSGATLSLAAGTHTITFAQLKDATYNSKTITFSDIFLNSDQETLNNLKIDTVAPVLSQITAIDTNTNDNTPTYTFRSNKAGILTTSITQGFSYPKS